MCRPMAPSVLSGFTSFHFSRRLAFPFSFGMYDEGIKSERVKDGGETAHALFRIALPLDQQCPEIEPPQIMIKDTHGLRTKGIRYSQSGSDVLSIRDQLFDPFTESPPHPVTAGIFQFVRLLPAGTVFLFQFGLLHCIVEATIVEGKGIIRFTIFRRSVSVRIMPIRFGDECQVFHSLIIQCGGVPSGFTLIRARPYLWLWSGIPSAGCWRAWPLQDHPIHRTGFPELTRNPPDNSNHPDW